MALSSCVSLFDLSDCPFYQENAHNMGRFSLYCLIKATDEEKILREDINIVSGL